MQAKVINDQQITSALLYDFVPGTAYMRSVFRIGNICVIQIHMDGMKLTGINGVICKIPEGFRPRFSYGLLGSIIFNGNQIPARITIDPNGDVRQTYGTGTVTFFMLYGVYVI